MGFGVNFSRKLNDGVDLPATLTGPEGPPSAALPTRRQWVIGAALGGTALVVDGALRPASAQAQNVLFVDTTSNQTIGGVKTFTQPPVVPAGTFALPQVPGTAMVAANVTGPFAPSSPGATAPTRYVGGTTSGAPTTGTFQRGDFVVDHTGALWICTAPGGPGTWVQQRAAGVDLVSDQTIAGVKTFTSPPVVPPGALPQAAVAGLVTDLAAKAPAAGPFAPSAPGATATTRYVGGTASGAPTTGSFLVGDFVVDQTAKVWICTVAGSPGTWAQQSGAGVDLTTDQTVGGVKTFTSPPVVPNDSFQPQAVAGLAAALAATTVAAGTYLGRAGPVTGASPGTVVGSARVADDLADRLQFRADGTIVGGAGMVPPTLELKPNVSASAWEINGGNLKIRADTDPSFAPEIHLHSINATGNDHLTWGVGIDVANPAGPARDLAIFKGLGGSVSDEFYANHRGLLPSTWAFGQAPADDGYKLSVVAGGAADRAMGGLKIQIGGTTTGHALTLKDGLQDRFWLDSAFWVGGQGNVSGASLQVKANASSFRTIAMAMGNGTGAFGFEHNTANFIRFRAISTATNVVQFGADGSTFLYGGVTMNAGATIQGGNLAMQDNRHVVLGTTNGTKIGTAPNQKLGFFNAVPVARPSNTPPAATDLASTMALVNNLREKLLNLGLVA